MRNIQYAYTGKFEDVPENPFQEEMENFELPELNGVMGKLITVKIDTFFQCQEERKKI